MIGERMFGKAFLRGKVDINNARHFTGGEDLDLTRRILKWRDLIRGV